MTKALQELILAEPTRALEIPDALPLLVTEDTVRSNIPELSITMIKIELVTNLTVIHKLYSIGRRLLHHVHFHFWEEHINPTR